MPQFPTRCAGTCLVVAIALSWPSALAVALVKAVVLDGHAVWPAFTAAIAISAVVSAGVGWAAWPSVRAASGLWGLYGILVALPMCSIWTALGESSRPNERLSDVAASSVGILVFAAPFAIVIGLLVGGDVALVVRLIERARDRKGIGGAWLTTSVALGLHYGVAVAFAVVFKEWK
jgi:hypothetical protein